MSESIHEYRLTEFAHAAGCGCKIAPAVLQEMLRGISAKKKTYPDLIAGNEGFEDAAVMDLGNGTSLISSTDFFSPIVDDAFDFGRIAAGNAISDIYAMGGKPLMALGILGWPVEKLPPALASKVMEGATSVCEEANIPLAGGHSIDAPEPFFGLSVNGIIPTKSVKRNHTIQEGDLIYLTKPIGVGILSTAIKRKQISSEDYAVGLHWMTQLNKIGEVLGKMEEIHALTDVTGFGLLGHLIEMVGDSGYSIELYYDRIPVIEAARHYLKQRIIPDATYRNWNHYHAQVEFGNGIDVMEAFNLLPDPQTNGGLLIALPENMQTSIKEVFIQNRLESFIQPIGKVISRKEKRIIVLSDID